MKMAKQFTNKNQDFISKLPNELLTKILSLIPDADANRTRILSNRWKNLYAFLPNLRFVIPPDDVSNNDQMLALRGGIPIQKLTLYCPKNCHYMRIYDLLCNMLVELKVQQLELIFPPAYDRYGFMFCFWDLFKTANTLVELTFNGQFMLHVPAEEDGLLFLSLKKINLISVIYSDQRSLTTLISSCPILEELYVERKGLMNDCLSLFKVSSMSLKKLRMVNLFVSHIYIDAPKLEHIHIEDCWNSDWYFTDMSCLNEAHISTVRGDTRVLRYVSSAKILTLTRSIIKALGYSAALDLPLFHNLVELVIHIDSSWYLGFLLILLGKTPNLEHFTFSFGPHSRPKYTNSWNPGGEAPTCLRYNMKKITMLSQQIAKQEFNITKYLLKHSNKLESFTVNTHLYDLDMQRMLLNLHRSSNVCRIEFV